MSNWIRGPYIPVQISQLRRFVLFGSTAPLTEGESPTPHVETIEYRCTCGSTHEQTLDAIEQTLNGERSKRLAE